MFGCHPDDHHHVNRNYKTLKKVFLKKKLLDKTDGNPKKISFGMDFLYTSSKMRGGSKRNERKN